MLFFSWITWGYAQTPLFTHFYKLNQQNGLSGTNIRKIISDPNGFIWIATQDGLNRFDGRTFTIFNSGVQDSALATYGSDFHDIVLDPDGKALWAACSNGAIHKINLDACKIAQALPLYGVEGDSTPLPIYQLIAGKGMLNAASNNGYLFRINTKNLGIVRKRNLAELMPGHAVIISKIMEDEAGLLWVFMDNEGIAVLDREWSKIIRYIPGSPGVAYNNVCRVMNDKVLVATNGGPLLLDTRAQQAVPLEMFFGRAAVGLDRQETTGVALVEGSLYLSNSKGLFRFDSDTKKLSLIKNAANYPENGLLSNAYALYADTAALWVGNREAVLLAPVHPSPFTGYQYSFNGNNASIGRSYHLLPVSDSVVYSCAPDGIYKINTFQSAIEKADGRQPYYQLVRCPDGNILASGEKQLMTLTAAGMKSAAAVYPELSIIQNDFLIASAVYKDSLLFLASQLYKGIYIWDARRRKVDTLTLFSQPAQLKDPEINNLFLDREGRLGIVCKSVYSVYDFGKRTITHHPIYDPLTKAPAALLMDACQIGDKYYFAAYGRGVIETHADLSFSSLLSWQSGITNNGLYKIYALGDSAFLASSNKGLFYYDRSLKKAHKISLEDGLHSDEFDETSGSRLGNYLYFGGLNGFTRIDITKLQKNPRPPLLWISAVKVRNRRGANEDITGQVTGRIKIPNDYTQVSILFSGLLFPNFNKVTYAYRIKELQDDWISNGTQNFIDLVGVKHGAYKLEVQAFNENGVGSAIRELTLVFLPRWYQTWWFRILVALAVAGFVYWLYLLRVRQLKREQQIRMKLANDLHDDLGSTMNSVKLYANLAMMDRHPEKYLPQIKESTQEAITGIKDIIWVLDDKRDGLEHLLTRIQHFVQPLCVASDVRYRHDITDDLRDYTLGREEKRNLYMMLKEAVNNALKYAEAKHISIEVRGARGKLTILVTDDGKGFETEHVTEGHGLKNMQTRSKEIRYDCLIRSAPGAGTLIRFQQR
ncbi:MAG TPA: ATP-binding protein [Chitinophaga sp.]